MPDLLTNAGLKMFSTAQLEALMRKSNKAMASSAPSEEYDYEYHCMIREELERRKGIPREVVLRRKMTEAIDEAFRSEMASSEKSGVMDTKGGE